MELNTTTPHDYQHTWHPASQMKDYATFKPLSIQRAYDSYFELTDGTKIIDAIASWWCKLLGHNHPRLKNALLKQINQFEHVILANTTNHTIEKLSYQLANLLPNLHKVFYASDGACAVEIALKMSLHTHVINGNTQRTQFITLKNSYHGETLGALSVSNLIEYKKFYPSLLSTQHIIEPPYLLSTSDPLWDNAEPAWAKILKLLEPYANTTAAILIEPIMQGAAGMKLYSKDFLIHLATWAKQNHIHLIADEIMTGLGRTGKILACEHANINPDFICLGKGLTSGWLPLSVVLTTNQVYESCYDDYSTGKAFLHSHTFSGNALAASVAIQTLEIIQAEKLCARASTLQGIMMKNLQTVAAQTGKLQNLRGIGAIVAADLVPDPHNPRLGYQVFQNAVKLGAYLRPINNTIYWLPPLNVKRHTLEELKNITTLAILKTYKKNH